jgi:hypothetical protein
MGMSSFAVKMLRRVARTPSASWHTSGWRRFPRPAIAATPTHRSGRTCPAIPAKRMTLQNHRHLQKRSARCVMTNRTANHAAAMRPAARRSPNAPGTITPVPTRIDAIQEDTSGGASARQVRREDVRGGASPFLMCSSVHPLLRKRRKSATVASAMLAL